MSFVFTIPGQPPSGNTMYRIDRRSGRIYKRSDVTTYQTVVASVTRIAMPRGFTLEPFVPKKGEGLVIVRLWYYLQRPVDPDNASKVINDGIKYGLGTHVVKTRSGAMDVRPIYDDERFLSRNMWLQTGYRADPHVDVEILPFV